MKRALSIVLIISMLLLAACSVEYDTREKSIVTLTVTRKDEEVYWCGSFVTYQYSVYFDIGSGDEWRVSNFQLYHILKKGDEISVFRTDYLKDGEIVKSEFEFIN